VVVDRDDATAATVAEHHPGARPRMGGGKPCRARP
jgi:hypothetical protein